MYDFSDYKTFKEFIRDIYQRDMSINEVERKQDEFNVVLNALSRYSSRDQKYIEAKNELLENVKIFTRGEKKLLTILKMEYFYS